MERDKYLPLLGAAYNALVENIVYLPDEQTRREAIRVIASLVECLEIAPEDEVLEEIRFLEE